MDSALILADQILTLIRNAGVSKIEAYAALAAANGVLPSVDDISFRNDLPVAEEQPDGPS